MNARFDSRRRHALPSLLVFVVSLSLLAALPERRPGNAKSLFTTITVNTTADTVAADGFCSLREAIQAANTNLAVNECPAGAAGLDTIEFNLGAGTPTINVLSALPTISQPIIINGNTGGSTRVELNGAGAGFSSSGLTISAGGSTVQALVINRFGADGIRLQTAGGNTIKGCVIGLDAAGAVDQGNNAHGINLTSANNIIGGATAADRNIISGNNVNGIDLSGAATGNQIQGNFIGTDSNGTADLGNTTAGINLTTASNTIGGTTAGAGNLISGNNNSGITINTASATNNVVQGNLIGTTLAGTAALGNPTGIFISSAPNNTIGGTTSAARNLISGNTSTGIGINGSTAANNTIQGNYLGTDINGTADLGNTANGIALSGAAHDNLIGGTASGAGNVISGNNSNGVSLSGATVTNNLIQGNFIGTNANGTAAIGNNSDGITISSAPNNTIGGTTSGARNIISGNGSFGASIRGATAANNTILGNYIGTDSNGIADIGNVSRGIYVDTGAHDNIIGGTVAGAGNVISGNDQEGIFISGNTTSANLIQGNFIGTNATGTAALGNRSGLGFSNATSNTIGGLTITARNVISGNNEDGVYISGAAAANNTLQGNYIGTDINGTADVGNTSRGVSIESSAHDNLIGGLTAGARNVISGNNSNGISLTGSANFVQGNFIGTNASGTGALTNSGHGVSISNAINNTIGGTASGASNLIAFNAQRGVIVSGATATGNPILTNSIYSNGSLGIDLGGTGVTANDAGDADTGPNNLQNFPVLTSVSSGGGNTTIQGTLNSTASTNFRIEFFSSPTCDASGNGEGQVYLGFANVTTNAGGTATINTTLPVSVAGGHTVTMTATDPGNNTSEFSACLVTCAYTLTPTSKGMPVTGGGSTVGVATAGGCGWTAVSNAPWITVTSGGSGSGNGTVSYTVAANPAPTPRTGSLTIAGITFYVTQAATGLLIATDFSNGIPPDWTIVDGGTGGGAASTWTTGNPCNRVIPPPFSAPFAIVDAACADSGSVQAEQLITPPFDATGSGSTVLQFLQQFRLDQGPTHTGDVDVSLDNGLTWLNVFRQTAESGVPTPILKSLDLTAIIAPNPANVRVRFNYYGQLPAFFRPTGGALIEWPIDNCSILRFSISPTSQIVVLNGGANSINVTTAAGAFWTAQSNVPWITLDPTSGTGSGTVGYTVAANLTGVARTGTVIVAGNTFTVNQQSTCPAITINPATLPAGRAGVAYNQALTQTGSAGVISWSLSAGALPNGLTLNAGGVLSGAPTVFGSFNFTASATDANFCTGERAYTLTVNPPCTTITVNPASLPNGVQGVTYNQTLAATGGTAPYSFTLTTGALPAGLNLAGSGLLAGTPTVAGTFNFTVTATDNTGCSGTRTYTLTSNAASNGLQFFPLPSPVRLLDTRSGTSACSQPNAPIAGGTARTQPGRGICTIPANAVALTGNITTVQSGGGFLTLYPSNATQPTVASTNYAANEVVNNVFTVGLGADGAFNIFAFNTTDVVVDVTGYYAPPVTGGLYFHPLPAPVRLLETRAGQQGCVTPGAPLTGNADSTQQAISPCTGIPAAARAIVGNATTVNPQGGGFLTLFPGDAARPLVASSNYNPGQIVNGPFSVGLSTTGQFKLYTFATTDLVVDVLGYYSTEANDVNGAGLLFTPLGHPVRLLETRAGQPVGCFKPGAPLNGNQEYTQTARGLCDGVTVPANALGVVGNATVIVPNGGGFLTLWPSTAASRPLVATANYNPGDVANRHFIVGLGQANGAFKMYSFATTNLVIDLSGYFAP